jgi:phage baseplate assembly protein W
MASNFTATEEVYSDFNVNFNIHPIKEDLTRLVNEDAVLRSIKNIVQTDHYERPFRPMFGANIKKYLFEQLNPITLQLIKSQIVSALANYEPRANIIDVVVSSSSSDNNSVEITITFSTINNLRPVTTTITLALDRVR